MSRGALAKAALKAEPKKGNGKAKAPNALRVAIDEMWAAAKKDDSDGYAKAVESMLTIHKHQG